MKYKKCLQRDKNIKTKYINVYSETKHKIKYKNVKKTHKKQNLRDIITQHEIFLKHNKTYYNAT